MPQTPAPAPIAPPAPAPIVVQIPQTPAIDGIPTSYGQWVVPHTQAEMAILQAQREAISGQIGNVRDRRNEIARAYERASGANRSGLEQQLRVLDQRILQLEQDLSESGRALTSARIGGTQAGTFVPPRPFNLGSGQVTAISIIFIVFVLGPLAASIGRMFWRRSAKPTVPPGWVDPSQRLERLEQAVDTIAVEIERVSEGQRFMTKLMTQGPAGENAAMAPAAMNGAQPLPALGPGSPEQFVSQKQRDEVRARRS